MTSYEYYKILSKKADDACYVGDFDKYDLLAEQATSFRNQNFTKQDWERLIEETNNIQAKIGFTKAMNKLFPEI